MRVHSIIVKNYGPFDLLEEIRLGPLATIVGQNDTGKSTILRALQTFFEKGKIDENNVHNRVDKDVVIEVAFTALPEKVQLEESIETTLQDEMLVDERSYLRIRKTYPRNNLSKFNISLIVHDFAENNFAGLTVLPEKDLNARCTATSIEVIKSGRGITNKGKREALRAKAKVLGIPLARCEIPLPTKDDLWKKINNLLPYFELFETDTKLGVGETTFQSQFRPIVTTAIGQPEVVDARDNFSGIISRVLQDEVDKIFEYLQQHTDIFTGLSVIPRFTWDKAFVFDILGRDKHGVENSLEYRGSGMRRLLMVAFFQYLAEREHHNAGNYVFAVEEPENCLHPGLQRELIKSFRELADKGYQIIITSHSPVFAGASPIDDLALVVRNTGIAKALQTPNIDLSDVAEQLGVEPADQITGYNAIVFIEGPDDILFWKAVATKLKSTGHILVDFADRNIGFVICGGDNLKHWINLRAMSRLNHHFRVVVDSDRASQQHNIPGRKLEWKKKCEAEGGQFFILHKREIENYLHLNAIVRSGRPVKPYDEFTDMKATFGENVIAVIEEMTSDEILQMDHYVEENLEHHELKEIVEALLA